MPTQVLPQWFVEALGGEPTDNVLNKRSETRHEWMVLAHVGPADPSNSKRSLVKVFNVSNDGIGFVSRQHIPEQTRIIFSPDGVTEAGSPFQPIEAVTLYSRQTIQGYKIGCSIL